MDLSRSTIEEIPSSQETEDPLAWIRLREDNTSHDRLEVAQIIGSEITDVRHFSPSRQPITLGNQNKHRLC
ncbi:MAG: hypothetical protein VX278_20670, partial [Myxococcota bacterium]|nr:hypothetical protein [Myxococcota bacterium]